MSLLTGLQLTGRSLLIKYGESVSFSRKVEGTYSTTTLTTATSTDTSYTAYGLSDPFDVREVDGTTVLDGDIRLFIHSGTLPLVGDVATFNSKAYRVMSVISYRCQGGDALYELQLRV